jgi:chromosome partitioning protein
MKVATICQRKGGNGKSTLTINLAHAYALNGKRVLVIDMDDQRNTSSTLPLKRTAAYTIEELLFDQYTTLEDAAEETELDGVSLIAGSRNMSAAAGKLDKMAGSHQQLLKKLLYSKYYDLCLIDTSPSLNILTVNAMCASHGIIIPITSNYFSFEGLSQTVESYLKVRDGLRKDLTLYGTAFVIHDGRNNLANEIQRKVKEFYPALLCETVIGRNIKIEEAQVRKQSIFSYAPGDRGAVQYRALAEELGKRMAL